MNKLFIFITILLVSNSTFAQSSLQQTQQQVESYLVSLTTRATTLYNNRCSSNCLDKTYNDCYEFAPELTCHSEYAKPSFCKYTGANLNYDHPAGRCSNDNTCSDSEDREIICGMAKLYDDQNLRFDQTSIIRYSYVGFHNSYRIIYPYAHVAFEDDGTCQEYDPRFRPWYVAGSTGAKNIIIVYDKSGSMQGSTTRYEKAEAALEAVLDTLGESDYFQIVYFSDISKGIKTVNNGSQLIKATQDNIKSAKQNINNITYEGDTNYEYAFDKAFDIFQVTQDSELASKGEKIILFLTDGDISEGKGTPGVNNGSQDIYDHIDTLNSDGDVSIFTYALGDTATITVPKRIACSHSGVFEQIGDQADKSEIVKAMRGYYTFLSSATTIDQPMWSQNYIDYYTGLEFVTVSLPIYKEYDNVQMLVGVAGVDLLVSDLEKFQDYENLLDLQARARSEFTESSLDECDMEKMRENKCDGDDGYTLPVGCTVNSNSGTYDTCGDNAFTSSPFILTGDSQDNLSICCEDPDPDYAPDNEDKSDVEKVSETIKDGLSGGAIAGIVIGAIAFLVIVGILVYCVSSSKSKKAKADREKQLREEHQKQKEEEDRRKREDEERQQRQIREQQEEMIRQQQQQMVMQQQQQQVAVGGVMPMQPQAPAGFDVNGQQIGNPMMMPPNPDFQNQQQPQQGMQQGYNYPAY